MNKNLRKWLFRFGLILVLLYGGICTFMYTQQESLLFHPEVLGANHRFQFEEKFEEVWLDSEHGGHIHGLLFPAENSQGVVLYLHGNGGNVEICSSVRNNFLRNKLDFFVIDYRGYGKSTGEMSEEGLHADAEAAWNYLSERYDSRFIRIYGQSLGTGIATQLAAKHQPRQLILECPYTSIKEVAQGQYPWLPIGMLLKYPLMSRDHVGKVGCEVVAFHGTEDDVIPYEMGKEMVSIPNKARLITLEGEDHKINDNPEYQSKLDQVLR